MNPLRDRPGPRPLTGWALGGVVLIAHAAAVLDWGALWALAQASEQAGMNVATSAEAGAAAPQAPRPLPQAVVRVAQVRWIAAPTAVTPTTPRPPPTARREAAWPKAQPTPPKAPIRSPRTHSNRGDAPAPSVAETASPASDNPPLLSDTLAQAPTVSNATVTPPQQHTEPPANPSATPTAPSDASSPSGNTAPSSPALQAAVSRPTLLPGNRWLRYDVSGHAKGLNYRANGEIRWQASDGRYQADFKISALLLGSRSQQSAGRLTDTGLMPERFADKSRSERATHFEPEQGRIRFSNNAPDALWRPGTQDRLSVFFQLAAWLNARPDSLREGQRLSLPVAGTGGADQWQLLVQTQETLDLPAGRWDSLRVEVLPQNTFDQRMELWLAPTLDHLPVRLRFIQANGDAADLQLSALP